MYIQAARICNEIKYCGVNGKALYLIASYLTNRTLHVSTKSSGSLLKIGVLKVPLILGPFLFDVITSRTPAARTK